MKNTPTWRLSARNLQRLFLFLTVLVVISLACGLPSQTQPQEEVQQAPEQPTDTEGPPPTPTIPPPPTPTPQPLPPALVESDPPIGAAIPVQGALTFYFNQAMDRGSVEGAISGQPQLSGQLSWLDDTTLVFEPDAAFPPDTQVTVELGTAARAANGLAMLEPIQLTYHTAAPMQVSQMLPQPDAQEADPSSAIVAAFDQPVVPLGADATTLPAAFTVNPAVSGNGEWINTSTYIFYPEPPLSGGTNYSVQLNPDLRSTTGGALQGLADSPGTFSWSFSTAKPQLLFAFPEAESAFVPLDAPIELRFNQSMDTASVEGSFSLLNPDGASIAGIFGWDEDFSTLVFTPTNLLARDTAYTLVLLGTAKSRGGSTIGEDHSQRIYTVPQFSVTGTDPSQDGGISIYESVDVNFSAPVQAYEEPEKYISISPSVDNLRTSTRQDTRSLYISGSFEPNTEYVLTISGAITDRWGQGLGQDYSLRFRTEPLQPMLYIAHGEPQLFVTPGDTSITAQATNIRNMDLSIGTVPPDQLWRFLGPTGYEELRNYTPEDVDIWSHQLDIASDRINTIELPLTPGGNGLPPGVYHYTASADTATSTYRQFLIISSHVHLTFKLSATQAFVWALDLRTNRPVPGAFISIYDETGGSIASGTTDEAGVFQAPIPVRPDIYGNFYAILGRPSDELFSIAYDSWDIGLHGSEFDVRTDYTGPRTKAYVYTDRPIYRPGHTVYFRAIVQQARNGRYSPPEIGILPVTIMNGSYEPILELELPLSEYGSGHGEFTLSDEAQPGYYQVNTPYGLVNFQVAEYRKPEIDLQVNADPDPAMAGQTINVQVEARYFFDAPAGNVPVTWSVYAAPAYFSLPGYKTGAEDYGWMVPPWMLFYSRYGESVSSGQGKTGPNGLLTIEIPTTSDEIAKRYTIEVTLEDESGFPISNRTDVVVHPADFYIGVHPDAWVGQAGQEISFEIKVVDWEQNPAGSRDLTADFQKVTFVRDEGYTVYDFPTYTPQYTSISSADFRTGDDGMARLAFTPPDPGTYVLSIKGGGTLTELTIWVGGPGQAVWPRMPNQRIQLTPNQDSYMPGDTAQIFIPNPLGDGVQALITVERGEVMRHQVITIDGSGYSLSLPLSDEDAPNVYLSVTLIGSNSEGQYDFRQGLVNLQVEPINQTLNVTLTPIPERAGPQDEVAFNVRVTDGAGNPMQGQFSLAVIDQAILALTEPFEAGIVEAFYGTQPLGVRTGLSLAAYAHRLTISPGGKGGGGGDAIAPTVREEFPDTAYWNAEIVTDSNGEAQITLQLPDSLTTWQASARGLTVDARVGEAEAELVSTKDLLIRPVTPRFVVVGDHLRLMGIVHNNTANDLTVEVNLQAVGFVLDDPGSGAQTISVPAGGRVSVEWWGNVEDVATLDLIFSASSGDLTDATRPVWGDIPVLRYTAPQTFGTAGTLTEGGERLEIVSLPRTYDPSGGELRVELAPSLAAAMLPGLDVLEHYPYECTEQTLSRFLPNLEAYRAIQELGLEAPDLEARLERTLNEGIQRLVARQNLDGGWGWWPSTSLASSVSDTYISAYVLFGLSQARTAGVFVDESVIQNAVNFLVAAMPAPEMISASWQLNRLAFQHFALAQAGSGNPAGVGALYEVRSQLSPWAKAFLALSLESISPGDPRIRELYSDLEATAIRTATGTHWEGDNAKVNMETPVFTTAVVIYGLAQHDPASATIPEAVRYLMAGRGSDGAWASTYETAWAIMGLTQVMKGTGELAGDFGFAANLNGVSLLEGSSGGDAKLNPVSASVPVDSLYPVAPNALTIQRETGPGRLYYTAHLNVLRPIEDVTPMDRGVSVSRVYETADQNPQAAVGELVTVKVALTIQYDAYYLVVEDYIPAGAEILDTSLKTSQQVDIEYDPRNPFGDGWGWWYFNRPQVYDDRIAWSVEYLPAGTYELTYTLVLNQPGEFRVLPTRAWEFYFPEVQGNSAGAIFVIRE